MRDALILIAENRVMIELGLRAIPRWVDPEEDALGHLAYKDFDERVDALVDDWSDE